MLLGVQPLTVQVVARCDHQASDRTVRLHQQQPGRIFDQVVLDDVLLAAKFGKQRHELRIRQKTRRAQQQRVQQHPGDIRVVGALQFADRLLEQFDGVRLVLADEAVNQPFVECLDGYLFVGDPGQENLLHLLVFDLSDERQAAHRRHVVVDHDDGHLAKAFNIADFLLDQVQVEVDQSLCVVKIVHEAQVAEATRIQRGLRGLFVDACERLLGGRKCLIGERFRQMQHEAAQEVLVVIHEDRCRGMKVRKDLRVSHVRRLQERKG